MSWQKRVIKERDKLCKRLRRLRKFLEFAQDRGLSFDDIGLSAARENIFRATSNGFDAPRQVGPPLSRNRRSPGDPHGDTPCVAASMDRWSVTAGEVPSNE